MTDADRIQTLMDHGIKLPEGTFSIDRTLLFHNRRGLNVQGTNGTTLIWTGPADQPMIRLDGIVQSSFRDLFIDSGRASAAFLTTSTAEYGSGMNSFSGVHTTGKGVAFQMGAGANVWETNCADNSWFGCSFSGHVAALRVLNYQGVNHFFTGCSSIACSTVFDFVRSGCLSVTGLNVAGSDGPVVLHVGPDGGQDNAAIFYLRGVRVETGVLVVAEANGGCLVNLHGCQQAGAEPGRSMVAIFASARSRINAVGCQLFGTVKVDGPDAGVMLRDCLLTSDPSQPGVSLENCASVYWFKPVPPTIPQVKP